MKVVSTMKQTAAQGILLEIAAPQPFKGTLPLLLQSLYNGMLTFGVLSISKPFNRTFLCFSSYLFVL